MRMTSAKICASVASREPLSSRSCLSRTNTHETTNSEVATMRPSSTSRRGLRRDRSDNSAKDAMAPIGYNSEHNLSRRRVSGVIEFRAHLVDRPDDLTDRPAQQGRHQRQPSESAAPDREASRVAGTCRREHQTQHRHDFVDRPSRVGALPPPNRRGCDQHRRDAVSPDDEPTNARGQPEPPPRISRPALHSRSSRSRACGEQWRASPRAIAE